MPEDEIQTPARPLIPQPHGGALAPTFPVGVSGNPRGRVPDSERILEALLRKLSDGKRADARTFDRVADTLLDMATDREHRSCHASIVTLLDRIDGPITQRQEHSIQTDKTVVTHAGPAHPPALPDARDADASQDAVSPDKDPG